MNVTNSFLAKARQYLTIHPEVSGDKYSMFDDGGVEVEVGEFLYGLVRIIKPLKVLTTGVYSGISDMYIAQGLIDNGFGTSDAIEYERIHIERAKKLWEAVGVGRVITEHLISSLDYKPESRYKLMFLDTEPQIRFQELVRFYPHLELGGYVFIHDLPRNFCQGNVNPDHPEIKSWPFGDLPIEIKNWVKDDELRVVHLPSPRGLVGFYKPEMGDLKWL